MTNWKVLGILLIVFGIITLAGSAFIYSYQMSQDGDLVYEDGNWYELRANPQVVSLMGTGMLVGICCIIVGLAMLFVDDDKRKAIRPGSYYQQTMEPSEQDRLMAARYAPQQKTETDRPHKYPVTVIEQGQPVNFCAGCGRKAGPEAMFCEWCGRRLK